MVGTVIEVQIYSTVLSLNGTEDGNNLCILDNELLSMAVGSLLYSVSTTLGTLNNHFNA